MRTNLATLNGLLNTPYSCFRDTDYPDIGVFAMSTFYIHGLGNKNAFERLSVNQSFYPQRWLACGECLLVYRFNVLVIFLCTSLFHRISAFTMLV